ncbi:hypothetical protein V8E54_010796 [Elaphomyces granulatus]
MSGKSVPHRTTLSLKGKEWMFANNVSPIKSSSGQPAKDKMKQAGDFCTVSRDVKLFLPSRYIHFLVLAVFWLYIDGGEIWATWYGSNTTPTAVYNLQTLAIDLTSSWTPSSVMAAT